MPSSLASSEPLSSPAPSPSPPPQGPRATASTNGAPAGLDSGSELSELTEDEQENTSRNANHRGEERPRPTKKRKRSQIIPTPMWGWAYADGKPPREEEEEHAAAATAMEEEEDDDRDSRPRSGTSTQRRRTRTLSGPPPAVKSDDERDFDPDDVAASADEADGSSPQDINVDEGEDMSDDEEKAAVAGVDIGEDAPTSRAKLAADAEPSDDEHAEDDDGEAPGDEDPPTPIVEPLVAESEDEADDAVTLPALPAPRPPASPVAHAPAAVTVDRKADPVSTLMDVDDTAPAAAQVSPIIAAAAASSIMAGSAVIDPPSPSSSTSTASVPSRRNASRSPSRSPSPEVVSDREVPVKRGAAKTRARPRNARRTRRRVKADAVLEPDADLAPTPMDQEDPEADPDDPDMDSPEMDMELELQPAHRAEALDVLATIELKYAMLRESLYVEKMESLAWEEALVAEGTHPEMLHLQAELSKRRDKRLELARRRRDYEVVNVTKRRKLDEDSIWSWWKLRRDELQTEMISETQRKRRQMDRDKRAAERPPPIRRIPSPPREIRAAPALRDLVKASPHDLLEYHRNPTGPVDLSYPQLSTLQHHEINNDLEFLFHQRRVLGMEAARMGFNPLLGHPLPGPPPFEPYNLGMGMLDGPGAPGRFHPYMSLQHGPMLPQPPPQQVTQSFLGVGPAPRLQHHHSAPPGAVPHLHPQALMDQDIPVNHRSAVPHSSMQTQHHPSGGPPLMRRSISPVPVLSNGPNQGAGPSSFGGSKGSGRAAMGGAGPSSLGLKEGRRHTSGSRNVDMDMLVDREKERERMFEPVKSRDYGDRNWAMEREHERERIREREQQEFEREMDRSNHVPHTLQRHPSHQHSHQHASGGPGNHVHGAHHHHVYHHHPGATNGQGPSFAGSSQTTNGLPPSDRSPLHTTREFEAQRQHLGVPVEVIELSSSAKSLGSSHTSSRKGREESLLLVDVTRERGRIGPGVSPHERTSSSFVQGNYPPSPRGPAGMSTAPTSRRGSWSAPDEAGMARPTSSASNHATLPLPHRVTSSSASLTTRPQLSPTLPPYHSPSLLSPPRNNGIRLPPLSPPQGANVRSPIRGPQVLPGPAVPPPPSGSSSKSVSPKVTRRSPPPSSSGRPKSPTSRERSHSGAQTPASSLGQKLSRMSPVSILPPPIPQPTSHPSSRLSNVGVEPDSNLVPVPKVNAVPVD